jgi:hypothetical protein
MPTHISGAYGQFAYFDHQLEHPDWSSKRVLDFGGNVGNILLDPNCTIDHDKYWSIDVSRDSITEGQRRHPNAHFVFYDRYNFEFNPTGTPGLPIPDLGQFDIIVGHSVFTHVPQAEMLEFAGQLLDCLTDDGKAAFSFMDPLWEPPPENADAFTNIYAPTRMSNLQWRLRRHQDEIPDVDIPGLLAQAAQQTELTWITLTNGELFFGTDDDQATDRPDRRCDTLCTPAHMRRLFPNGQIAEPVAPVRMHCLIIDKASRRG